MPFPSSCATGSSPSLNGCLVCRSAILVAHRHRCRSGRVLYHDGNSWPKAPLVDIDGDENWLAETTGRDIAFPPAKAGDLIVWDWRLPHGNSKNLPTRPRIVFYVAMYPDTNIALRDAA